MNVQQKADLYFSYPLHHSAWEQRENEGERPTEGDRERATERERERD